MDIRRCGCGGHSKREIFDRTRVRAGLVRKLEPGEREVHSWRKLRSPSFCKGGNHSCKGLNSCKGQGLVISSAAQECMEKGGHLEGSR